MTRVLWLLALWSLIPCLTSLAADDDKTFGRDPDAIYLVDYPDQAPIVLKVLNSPTRVYGDKMLSVQLKTFVADDTVQLLAYTPKVYYVRNYKTNYEGWVSARDISPINQDQLNNLQASVEWNKKVQESIKRKEVIPGMTPDQVRAALGKPDTTSFRQDENGRMDKWSYITYETQYRQQLVTDAWGRNFYQSIPYKVPVGSLNVEFKNNYVTALEKVQNPSTQQ
ncbi:MAG: hypothetical protein LBH01_00960 [Verrucomicrobiales bacterium]|jgi:hypothetical protein|nr:hypothetical protein [Verrucomicrobiales bacterium]